MFVRLAVISLATLGVFAVDPLSHPGPLHSTHPHPTTRQPTSGSSSLASATSSLAATTSPSPIPPPANLTFGYLVFPKFVALDAFGPIEMLNILTFLLPGTTLLTIGQTLDAVPTSSRGSVTPQYTIYDHPPLDILYIPGGPGSRLAYNNTEIIDFVRNTYPTLKYIVSVCTGAQVLAKAGILDGKRATTNKFAWKEMVASGPTVNWVPEARWVVDGNIWTSSGVTAGMDLTYAFINHLYGNQTLTDRIAGIIEYSAHTDATWDPFAEYWNVTGTKP